MKNVIDNKKGNEMEPKNLSQAQKEQLLFEFTKRITEFPAPPQDILQILLETLESSYKFDLLFLSDILDPPIIAKSSEVSLDIEDLYPLLTHIFEQKGISNKPFLCLSNKRTEFQNEFDRFGIKSLLVFQIRTNIFPEYFLGFISFDSIFKPSEDDFNFFSTLANTVNLSISYNEIKLLFKASYNQLQENIERIQRENDQRHELFRKVREQTKELKRKHNEMEEFVYTISHDLKAPLISIQGFVTALNEDFANEIPEDAMFYLERITKNTSQIKSMIQEVLEYSRIGRISQEKKIISLKEIINDSLTQFSTQIQAANFKIIYKGGFPEIYAEENRILQLFGNLIGNSIKYIGDQLEPFIEFGVQEIGSKFVTVYVKDNGIGIPEDYRDKVFNIFSRSTDSEVQKIEGTGIGLAHVKKIIETHGGSIWLESEEKKGTTMFFKLPIAKKAN
ncbi:MAG: ATP-binding protein [Candidatus Hodarchaeales archaeon]